MLTIVTSATGDQLSTLASFKWALNGASTATSTAEDDLLNSLLSAASQIVEKYVGYPLRRMGYSETVAGYDTNRLMVSRTPVQSVSAIWHLPENSQVTTDSYYLDNPDAGIIHRDLGFYWTAGIAYDLDSHVIPNSETRVFQVDYTAGYVLSGSTTTYDIMPTSIERATLDTAVSFYRAIGADPLVESQSIGDLSVTYARQGGEGSYTVTALGQALLQPYRRIV